MQVDISQFSMQNFERVGGELRVRRGLQSLRTPTVGSKYIAAYSVDDKAGNVWHYLVERKTSTKVATVFCYSDTDIVSYSGLLYGSPLVTKEIGPLPDDCAISFATVTEQITINSPAMHPLFGVVLGPLVSARPLPSENEATTAIDVPSGHVCRFGDRTCIANGQTVFVCEPRSDLFQRTYSAVSRVSVSSAVHGIFQGPGGALWIFTASSAFTLPVDAIGQGQSLEGFMSEMPTEGSYGPQRAGASRNSVMRLTARGFRRLPQGEDVELDPYQGKRRLGKPLSAPDFTSSGRVYPNDNGYFIAVRGTGSWFDVNERQDYQSLTWIEGQTADLVGSLRGRGGDILPVTADHVLSPYGWEDIGAKSPHGVLMGTFNVGSGRDVGVRRVTVSTDNIGLPVAVALSSQDNSKLVRLRASESSVNSGQSETWTGRERRRTPFTFGARGNSFSIEIQVDGGEYSISREIEIETLGERSKP